MSLCQKEGKGIPDFLFSKSNIDIEEKLLKVLKTKFHGKMKRQKKQVSKYK